jgi:hypothetical protein
VTIGSKDVAFFTEFYRRQPSIRPVLFLKLEFDGGDINIHSDLGDLTWGGDTYTGVGRLGSVSTADEVSDLSLTTIKLTLSGLPNDLTSILFNQQYQGRTATLFIGYLNPAFPVLVDDPMILYRGLIDTANFATDKNFSITLSIGSRFSAWSSPNIRRYNNADQQGRFPADKGLQFIEQTTNKTIIWGGAT